MERSDELKPRCAAVKLPLRDEPCISGEPGGVSVSLTVWNLQDKGLHICYGLFALPLFLAISDVHGAPCEDRGPIGSYSINLK